MPANLFENDEPNPAYEQGWKEGYEAGKSQTMIGWKWRPVFTDHIWGDITVATASVVLDEIVREAIAELIAEKIVLTMKQEGLTTAPKD